MRSLRVLGASVATALALAAPASAAPTHAVRIDASALSTTQFRLDRTFAPGGSVGVFAGTTPQDLALEEGTYQVIVSAGLYMACSPTVTPAGTWSYPASCDGFVHGRGTDTLTLDGYPVTLDARPLSNTIRLGGFGPATFFSGPETMRLVPNQSSIGAYTVHPGSAVTAACGFNVTLAGTVDYAPAFEGCLSGAGSSTLTFNGVPVRVDATALTAKYFTMSGANTLFNNLQPTSTVQAYRMLPLSPASCCYGFRATGSPVASTSWNVDLSSHVSYPQSDEPWVHGQGTDTLQVVGYAIDIDATRLGAGSFFLENRHFFPDPFDRSSVRHTRLVPGDYAFSSADFPQFAWSVTRDGKIDIAGTPDCVSGEGTTTLVVSCNHAPDCSAVTPSSSVLWPPDHRMVPVTVSGASDPDADALTWQVTSVTQDERVDALGDGSTGPDARVTGPSGIELRAERSGTGDGRVYRVAYSVADGRGGTCTGAVTVAVPHDWSWQGATDSGQAYDSLA